MDAYYLKTNKHFSERELLLCWRTAIPWLVERAKHYQIVCHSSKKGASETIDLLTEHADSREEKERRIKSKIVNSILNKLSNNYPTSATVFKGDCNQELADILLLDSLPDTSVAADIAPCEEVVLFRNDEIMFSSYDYGIFQSLFISKEEARELRDLLENAGLLQQILAEQRIAVASHKSPWFFAGKIDRGNKEWR